MKRRTRPPLTNKRKDYVQARASGLLVGEPLHYPAGVADRYRDGLDKLVQQMMREYKREVAALWREYAPITQDASLASQSALALTRLKNKFARLFKERAPALIDQMLGGVDKASATGLQKSLKELSGGVTLKTDTMPAPLAEIIKATTYENVKLITNIPEQTALRIEGAVMRSIQQGGEGRKTILQELERIGGMKSRRVKLIAEDQTRKITSAMNAERSKALGITKARWVHSRGGVDKRQKHVDFNGKIFDLNDPPPLGDKGEKVLPGFAVNCHPGNSNVEITNACVKLYRRRYSGELLTLVSNDGVILEATPNHPILTSKGWKAAKEIDLGDYLVKRSHESINVGEANIKRAVTKFDQLFESAAILVGGSTTLAGNPAFEFHGDVSDSEVDVISFSGLLSDEGDPSVVKQISELILAFADSAFNVHGVECPSNKFIMATLNAPDSVVRSLSAFFSKLNGESGGAYKACLGLVSYIDIVTFQNPAYERARNSVFFRQLKLAHTSGVFDYNLIIRQILSCLNSVNCFRYGNSLSANSLGKIVSVDPEFFSNGGKTLGSVEHFERVVDKFVSKDFSGHVYNLETVRNWYSVNGIVTHNCRCFYVPVIEWGLEDSGS